MTDFNKKLNCGEAILKAFPGATTQQLCHYTIPTLIDESPEVAVIHVGINDFLKRKSNVDEVVKYAHDVAVRCASYNVKKEKE